MADIGNHTQAEIALEIYFLYTYIREVYRSEKAQQNGGENRIEGVNLMIVPVQKIRAETERYLEKRFQDGQRKGIEQGIEQGLRESILDVLEIRFDLLKTDPLSTRIAAIDDLQRLKQLHRAAIQVVSLEVFQHLLDA